MFKKLILLIAGIATLNCSSFGQNIQNDILPDFAYPIRYPAISPDGKYLIFGAIVDPKSDFLYSIYESNFEKGKWTKPTVNETLTEFAKKSKNPIGGFAFNYNGLKLLFHAKVESSYDLYLSTRENNKWTEPKKLEGPMNSEVDEFSPSISANENLILFLRPKKNVDAEEGCKEIVMYRKDDSEQWVGPTSLNLKANEGCQETPFLCYDNMTLFFASQRPDTNRFGKKVDDDNFNIYQMKRYTSSIVENLWYDPVYVDEFNTDYDDLSPCMNLNGDYFIKNTATKKLSKKQGNKVYNIEVPKKFKQQPYHVLKGKIVDLYTKEPLIAKVIVTDAFTSVPLGRYTTDSEGNYSIFLDEVTNYKFDYTKDGYSHTYFLLKTDYFGENKEQTFNTELYNKVVLDLNVFDNELFYPLGPKITLSDSISDQVLIDSLPPTELGKFNCKLDIGKLYKFHIECKNFEPVNYYFDLRSDVQYSNFEQDMELQIKKKQFILEIDEGDPNDTSAVRINIMNLTRNETTTVLTKRDKDGNLIVELREGDVYELDVSKKGYTYYNTKVDVNRTQANQKIEVNLELLTTETKMEFNNTTFEYNSSELNMESYKELDRLTEFLILNNELRIELSAHTDDVGSDNYNLRLSEKRAESVKSYLVTHGVTEKNIVTKGYGESRPLVPNTSDENRAKNRRVEVKIIE